MFDDSVRGKRVRLRSTSDQYTNLRRGDEGTADHYDDSGTLHIKWDRGQWFGLIPGEDDWEWLEEGTHEL